MENENMNGFDHLGEMIRQTPLESPSDNFINRVMTSVQTDYSVIEQKKTIMDYLRTGLPYAALIVFSLLIYFTSDIPGLNILPGQGFLSGKFMTCCISLFSSFRYIFSSGYITWGILIGFAGGLIYFIDQIFSRKTSY